MGTGRLLLAVLALSFAAPAAAQSDIPCWCRDQAGQHPLGTILCLKVGGRERLMRCERVQNNTSWRVLAEECPTAALTPAPPRAPKAHALARL